MYVCALEDLKHLPPSLGADEGNKVKKDVGADEGASEKVIAGAGVRAEVGDGVRPAERSDNKGKRRR